MAMRTASPTCRVARLHLSGFLTQDEYRRWQDWSEEPGSYTLPAPLLEILLEVARPGALFERIETSRGVGYRLVTGGNA